MHPALSSVASEQQPHFLQVSITHTYAYRTQVCTNLLLLDDFHASIHRIKEEERTYSRLCTLLVHPALSGVASEQQPHFLQVAIPFYFLLGKRKLLE